QSCGGYLATCKFQRNIPANQRAEPLNLLLIAHSQLCICQKRPVNISPIALNIVHEQRNVHDFPFTTRDCSAESWTKNGIYPVHIKPGQAFGSPQSYGNI